MTSFHSRGGLHPQIERRPILEAHSALQTLLEKPAYDAADKALIVKLLGTLGLLRADQSKWAFLRRSRGQLLRRRRDGTVEVTASGRGSWIGWVELKREAVNEVATRNTARVVADVAADVLAVVEAEDRPALQRFNEDVLPFGFDAGAPAFGYRHVMLIDGNDDRGIDVGLLTRDPRQLRRWLQSLSLAPRRVMADNEGMIGWVTATLGRHRRP